MAIRDASKLTLSSQGAKPYLQTPLASLVGIPGVRLDRPADVHRQGSIHTFQWPSECCMNSSPSLISAFISCMWATVCTDHASVGSIDKAFTRREREGHRKQELAWLPGPSKSKGGDWALTQNSDNPNTSPISYVSWGYQYVPCPPQQAAEEGISASLTDEEN